MKKKWLVLVLVLLFSCVYTSCADKKEQTNPKAEYLIDIIVENDENLHIEHLTLSFVNNKEIVKITDARQSSQESYVHFAVGYSDEEFILTGKSKDEDKEIKPFHFNLKHMKDVENPQELKFYIHEKNNEIIITQ